MAFKPIGYGLSVIDTSPLDDRYILASGNPWDSGAVDQYTAYEGMQVYSEANSKMYVFTASVSVANLTDIENWLEVGAFDETANLNLSGTNNFNFDGTNYVGSSTIHVNTAGDFVVKSENIQAIQEFSTTNGSRLMELRGSYFANDQDNQRGAIKLERYSNGSNSRWDFDIYHTGDNQAGLSIREEGISVGGGSNYLTNQLIGRIPDTALPNTVGDWVLNYDGTFFDWVESSGGVDAYSDSISYEENDVVYWTDNNFYRWTSSTNSVAGTDPSESDDWVEMSSAAEGITAGLGIDIVDDVINVDWDLILRRSGNNNDPVGHIRAQQGVADDYQSTNEAAFLMAGENQAAAITDFVYVFSNVVAGTNNARNHSHAAADFAADGPWSSAIIIQIAGDDDAQALFGKNAADLTTDDSAYIYFYVDNSSYQYGLWNITDTGDGVNDLPVARLENDTAIHSTGNVPSGSTTQHASTSQTQWANDGVAHSDDTDFTYGEIRIESDDNGAATRKGQVEIKIADYDNNNLASTSANNTVARFDQDGLTVDDLKTSNTNFIVQASSTGLLSSVEVPKANTSDRGGVKIGFSEGDTSDGVQRNIPLEMNSSDQAFVGVPYATNTAGGMVSTGQQEFAGVKTFDGNVTFQSTTTFDANVRGSLAAGQTWSVAGTGLSDVFTLDSDGDIGAIRNLSLSGNLTTGSSGTTTINNTFNVDGAADFSSMVTFDGAITVSDDFTMNINSGDTLSILNGTDGTFIRATNADGLQFQFGAEVSGGDLTIHKNTPKLIFDANATDSEAGNLMQIDAIADNGGSDEVQGAILMQETASNGSEFIVELRPEGGSLSSRLKVTADGELTLNGTNALTDALIEKISDLPAANNVVTLDGQQTITGQKRFTADLDYGSTTVAYGGLIPDINSSSNLQWDGGLKIRTRHDFNDGVAQVTTIDAAVISTGSITIYNTDLNGSDSFNESFTSLETLAQIVNLINDNTDNDFVTASADGTNLVLTWDDEGAVSEGTHGVDQIGLGTPSSTETGVNGSRFDDTLALRASTQILEGNQGDIERQGTLDVRASVDKQHFMIDDYGMWMHYNVTDPGTITGDRFSEIGVYANEGDILSPNLKVGSFGASGLKMQNALPINTDSVYSETATYSQGDVVYWRTEGRTYVWDSSTDSVAGTDPSESTDWKPVDYDGYVHPNITTRHFGSHSYDDATLFSILAKYDDTENSSELAQIRIHGTGLTAASEADGFIDFRAAENVGNNHVITSSDSRFSISATNVHSLAPFRFMNTNTDPTSPSEGWSYWHTGTKNLRIYDDTADVWMNVGKYTIEDSGTELGSQEGITKINFTGVVSATVDSENTDTLIVNVDAGDNSINTGSNYTWTGHHTFRETDIRFKTESELDELYKLYSEDFDSTNDLGSYRLMSDITAASPKYGSYHEWRTVDETFESDTPRLDMQLFNGGALNINGFANTNADEDGAVIRIGRSEDLSVTEPYVTGQLQFTENGGNGPDDYRWFANIKGLVEDVSGGTEDGQLQFLVKRGGGEWTGFDISGEAQAIQFGESDEGSTTTHYGSFAIQNASGGETDGSLSVAGHIQATELRSNNSITVSGDDDSNLNDITEANGTVFDHGDLLTILESGDGTGDIDHTYGDTFRHRHIVTKVYVNNDFDTALAAGNFIWDHHYDTDSDGTAYDQRVIVGLEPGATGDYLARDGGGDAVEFKGLTVRNNRDGAGFAIADHNLGTDNIYSYWTNTEFVLNGNTENLEITGASTHSPNQSNAFTVVTLDGQAKYDSSNLHQYTSLGHVRIRMEDAGTDDADDMDGSVNIAVSNSGTVENKIEALATSVRVFAEGNQQEANFEEGLNYIRTFNQIIVEGSTDVVDFEGDTGGTEDTIARAFTAYWFIDNTIYYRVERNEDSDTAANASNEWYHDTEAVYGTNTDIFYSEMIWEYTGSMVDRDDIAAELNDNHRIIGKRL